MQLLQHQQGVDRTLCFQDTVYLAANRSESGRGRWTQLSGPNAVQFSSFIKSNPLVSRLQVGTYSFVWTVSNGICSTTDTVSLTLVASPVVNASATKQLCLGQQATLTATSNGTRFTWTDDQNQTVCTDCLLATVTPRQSCSFFITASNEVGCTTTDTVSVQVIQPMTMRTTSVDTICIGEETRLSSRGASSYSWYPASGLNRTDIANPVARPTTTTTYTVVGRDAYGCFIDTGKVTVVVGTPSVVRIGSDTTVIAGATIKLRADIANGTASKYTWKSAAEINCPTCPAPVAKITTDACISCTIINSYGCVSSDTICVKTFCTNTQVFIPNAFSPDGDGVNDRFYVMGTGIKIIKQFRVFNRWGQLVFEKTNFSPNNDAYGWDGKVLGTPATPDIYVYTCEVICENNTPYIYKGNVAVLK
jgi:gliding motility-associated-like protein